MSQRVLLIDEAVRAAAQRLRQHAIEHKETLSELLRRMPDPSRAPGNDPAFCLEIPDGWRVVLSVEQHTPPYGWLWHLSFSVSQREPGEKLTPNPTVVEQVLLPLLGFPPNLKAAVMAYVEDQTIPHLWFRCPEVTA